jgi:hypothetical protein
MLRTFFLLSTTLVAIAPAAARAGAEVKFGLEPASVRAERGLGAAWNDKNNPVRVHVGDVLVFTNGDTVGHIIHTNGAPFPHTDRKHPILPGETVRLPIERPLDPYREGPLYDHAAGIPSGQLFWIVAD